MKRKTERTNPLKVTGAVFLVALLFIGGFFWLNHMAEWGPEDYIDLTYSTMDTIESVAYQGYWGSQEDAYHAAREARNCRERLLRIEPPGYFSRLYSLLLTYSEARMRSFYSRYQVPSGRFWKEQKETADSLFDEVLSELYRIEVM